MNNGGKRIAGPGKRLGRPPKPKGEKYAQMLITLPPEIAKWLRSQQNYSGLITNLVRNHIGRAAIVALFFGAYLIVGMIEKM